MEIFFLKSIEKGWQNEEVLTQEGYGTLNFVAGWQFKPRRTRFEASVFGVTLSARF